MPLNVPRIRTLSARLRAPLPPDFTFDMMVWHEVRDKLGNPVPDEDEARDHVPCHTVGCAWGLAIHCGLIPDEPFSPEAALRHFGMDRFQCGIFHVLWYYYLDCEPENIPPGAVADALDRLLIGHDAE